MNKLTKLYLSMSWDIITVLTLLLFIGLTIRQCEREPVPRPAAVETRQAPDTVLIGSRAADSTALDSLRGEIARLSLQLIRAEQRARKRPATVIIRDTVTLHEDAGADTTAPRITRFISSRIFKRDYLTARVEALAPAPVDSFGLRTAVDFERWYRERRRPLAEKERWADRAMWFFLGAAAVAIVAN